MHHTPTPALPQPLSSLADAATHAGCDSGSARQAATAEGAVDSSALLQGHKAVSISHNGALYRLQATRLGKLILTK